MTRPTRPYHYRQCGLDNVYLRNGLMVESTKRGKTISIRDIDGLHRAIGMCRIREKKVLAGAEIRFLRHELDLSQKTLGDLLDMSSQTVGRWEKGECRIDGAADRLLRLLYEGHAVQVSGGSSAGSVRSLLEELAELDDVAFSAEVHFEDTGRGWSRAA